jgi:hypothetical protein
MESTSVRTLASSYGARKQRVRYTAHYPGTTQNSVVLYSGSEQGYKAHAPNYEEMFTVFSGTSHQFHDFMTNVNHKVLVHKENWDNIRRHYKEPWSCKRAIGEYSRPTEMYQSELTPVSFRSSKYED